MALINIITRTHKRPNKFSICRESITQQTHKQVRHLVTYQSEEDLEYLKNYEGLDLFEMPNIPKDWSLKHDMEDGTQGISHAPYNLFFNEVHKHITDGWVLYLDDDDMFGFNNCLEALVSEIGKYDENMKHFWRVKFPTYLIPSNEMFQKYKEGEPLKKGQISGIGFCFHSSHLPNMVWHEWALGDYYSITGLEKTNPNRNMIDLPLTQLQGLPGNGRTNDM